MQQLVRDGNTEPREVIVHLSWRELAKIALCRPIESRSGNSLIVFQCHGGAVRFWTLYAVAVARGLFYRWPRTSAIPEDSAGVHCNLPTLREVRGMYRLGWEPRCFQFPRDPATGQRFAARLFRVRNTPSEIEFHEALDRRHDLQCRPRSEGST